MNWLFLRRSSCLLRFLLFKSEDVQKNRSSSGGVETIKLYPLHPAQPGKPCHNLR
jgi:hypothetical protein